MMLIIMCTKKAGGIDCNPAYVTRNLVLEKRRWF